MRSLVKWTLFRLVDSLGNEVKVSFVLRLTLRVYPKTYVKGEGGANLVLKRLASIIQYVNPKDERSRSTY